ncbi:MAG: DUF2258 domain-containing protein [Nitrososphaerota archaeon]
MEPVKTSITTGFVIAGAYADKLRKTLFAQVREYVKTGQVRQEEVARAAGELNSLLFRLIVEELGLSKGDVVRIRAQYQLSDGKIKWDLSSLQVEMFKRVPEDQVNKVLATLIQRVSE